MVRIAVVTTILGAQVAVGAGVAAAAEPSQGAQPCVGCGPSSHVVQPGEWLWKIARADLTQRGINSGELSFVRSRANAIYLRNRALIGSNPNLIRPGMRLVLPDL